MAKLETRNVGIDFAGVRALDNVNFSIETGEIRAVVGANGAGKSTLMKVVAGVYPQYSGEILIDGEVVDIKNPIIAKQHGIQIVYQEVDQALYPSLSVAENIVQNDMIMGKSGMFVDWKKVNEEGRKALDHIHVTREQIDEKALVKDLSLAQKQLVLIAKARRAECKFLIFDEPTAPLSDAETQKLFNIVEYLHTHEDIAIIFISHRLNEILQICTKYTVLRNGKLIDTKDVTKNTTTREIVEMMLGRSFEESFPKEKCDIGDVVFETSNLCGAEGMVDNVSIKVKKGEIVGIAGLVGAGKSEFCKTVFGALKKTGGKVILNSKEVKIDNPADAVKYNIALVPEERRKEGVLVNETVSFNLSAAGLDKFCSYSFVRPDKVEKNANRFIDKLGIVTPNTKKMVKLLSGGNQQKVAVGKWLAVDSDVYIFDEPTKGVDVAAKQDIFRLINDIAKQGNAVIYATCENSELLSLTDRIYVMYSGKIEAELETDKTTEDEIMYYSVGGDKKDKNNGGDSNGK